MTLILSSMSICHAGLLASSTRVIYNQNETEKALMLVNTNDYPVLTQIWIDQGQSDPEFKDAPFAVIPSVFKLTAKESKGIRIIYNSKPLPSDRESMYWLNLYEIPATKKNNISNEYLNLAMNTQLKIFYRPKGLKEFTLDELQKQLQYQLISNNQKTELKLKNPTPYYLNLMDIKIKNNLSNSIIQHNEDNVLPPFTEKTYTLINANFKPTHQDVLTYSLIDDSGRAFSYSVKLQ